MTSHVLELSVFLALSVFVVSHCNQRPAITWKGIRPHTSVKTENNEIRVVSTVSDVDLKGCIDNCQRREVCKYINYHTSAHVCFLFEQLTGSTSFRIEEIKVNDDTHFVFGQKSEWVEENWGQNYSVCRNCSTRQLCTIEDDGGVNCTFNECPEPPIIADAQLLGNKYTIGSRLRYRCKTTKKSYGVVCQPNGTWSTVDFTCRDSDDVCPDGQEELVTGCTPCERGFYKENRVDDVESKFGACQPCPSTLTTDGDGSTAIDQCNIPVCEAGEYIGCDACMETPCLEVCGNALRCIPCELDTFSGVDKPLSTTTCSKCDDFFSTQSINYGTRETGVTTRDQCKGYCIEGGYELQNNVCKLCDRGYYKDLSEGRFGSCTACPGDLSTDGMGADHVDMCVIRSGIRWSSSGGGEKKWSGVVEMYNTAEGEWGKVCDEHWDYKATRLLCRDLNPYAEFGGSFHDAGAYGSGDFNLNVYKLHDLDCSGATTSLLECTYKLRVCNKGVLGITCYKVDVTNAVRLVDGSGKFDSTVMEGRVEVFYNGMWSPVCNDGWRREETDVVCKSLNPAWKEDGGKDATDCEEGIPRITNHIKCDDKEDNLMFCRNMGWNISPDEECDCDKTLKIKCKTA